MYACFIFCFPLLTLFVMLGNRFASIVKKLKASNYVGPDLLNKLATSERTVRTIRGPKRIFGCVENRDKKARDGRMEKGRKEDASDVESILMLINTTTNLTFVLHLNSLSRTFFMLLCNCLCFRCQWSLNSRSRAVSQTNGQTLCWLPIFRKEGALFG
jgi:hypothetical protein